MSIQALREKRAKLVEQARAVMAAAETESRSVTAEESAQFEKLMAEVDQTKASITRLEALEQEERALGQSLGRFTTQTTSTRNDALRSWLLNDKAQNLTFALRSLAPRSLDVKSWESRAQSFAATEGGELVPQGFVNSLEAAMLQFGGMRSVSSVIRTETGNDLPWPMVNDVENEGAIVGTNAAITEADIEFAQAVLKAHKYTSKLIRVPVELIQDSAIDLSSEIGTRLGERIGRVTNRHFTVGAGTTEPQGIITAAPIGKVGASVAAIAYEEIVDLIHSVNAAYRSNAKFMFADSTLRELRKLRDNDGKLIWQAGMTAGEPDRILGYEYIVNDAVPAMAANAKSVVFGDLSKYKIRDVSDVTLVRLNERYADFAQVGFLALSRHDGLLLDAGTNPVKVFRNAAA